MRKKTKRFWRNFGPSLVLFELCTYLVLGNRYFIWQFACFAFLAVNSFIVIHLVNIKIRVEQHNAKVDADTKAAAEANGEVSEGHLLSDPTATMPALA